MSDFCVVLKEITNPCVPRIQFMLCFRASFSAIPHKGWSFWPRKSRNLATPATTFTPRWHRCVLNYFYYFLCIINLFSRLTVTECSTTSAPACAATSCAVTSSPAVSTSRQSTSSSTLTSPRWRRHTCTGSAAAEGD